MDARNRRENGARFSDIVRTTDEVLNPRVTCGFSRENDVTHHAPAEVADPFTSKKVVDTEGD